MWPQKLYSQHSIRDHIPLKEIISSVEEAFVEFAAGRAQMPAKDYLLFNQHNGDLRTMSAYIEKFNLATVKLVNSHPNNPSKHDLPTVMALLCVFDPETGMPIAIMDATELTKLRTAASSALATRQFTPESVTNLGIIGIGGQAKSQLQGQLWARDLQTVSVFDINREHAKTFIGWGHKTFPEINFRQEESVEKLLLHSQVIVSLTPGRKPLVNEIGESPVKHINAMGADGPGKQEWPDSLLQECRIIVDDWEQARHSGEIQRLAKDGRVSEDELFIELGTALAEDIRSPVQRTIFDSTGLAIQDTACAKTVLDSNLKPDEAFSFLGTP